MCAYLAGPEPAPGSGLRPADWACPAPPTSWRWRPDRAAAPPAAWHGNHTPITSHHRLIYITAVFTQIICIIRINKALIKHLYLLFIELTLFDHVPILFYHFLVSFYHPYLGCSRLLTLLKILTERNLLYHIYLFIIPMLYSFFFLSILCCSDCVLRLKHYYIWLY